ncbi:MAG TPA: PLP-dependent aspartate aminotransferase family protein, partial [Pedococcus sp.]
DLAAATRVVALGRPVRRPGAGVNAPLELSSTYVADGPVNYARGGNPTWSAFEEALGSLEGGQALVFASGMGAVAAAVSLVPHGGAVVVPEHAYNGTTALLDALAEEGRVEVRRYAADGTSPSRLLEGAAVLWVESPTNPMLEVSDVSALAAAARAAGALVVCDNTFATPLVQQPLALGADVVVHSVTKYLSGHSDVVLGALVTRDDEPGRALRARLSRHRLLHGAIAGPVETWLALRGLRTLHLRVERATANARELAARLEGHPAAATVRYPGFGAIVALEVAGGAEAAERVAAACRIWTHSTSLGGVESQLERRRRHPGEPVTVPEELLRLSVGVEDVEDLWRDLDAALRA